jgi:hypothetical protein
VIVLHKHPREFGAIQHAVAVTVVHLEVEEVCVLLILLQGAAKMQSKPFWGLATQVPPSLNHGHCRLLVVDDMP